MAGWPLCVETLVDGSLMTLSLCLEVDEMSDMSLRLSPPLPVCSYCAQGEAAFGRANGPAACALCFLVHHLERPRIDDEAVLIWLPEMDQRAISLVCREMHLSLHAAHEPLCDDACRRSDGSEVVRISRVRAALRARGDGAASRLGTDRPSELGEALRCLPRAARLRQPELLGGLRLLPRGRFFDGGEDVYPSIVEAWRSASTQPGSA